MAAMKPVWGALMALSVAWAGGSAGELKTFGYGYHAGGTVATKTYPSGQAVRMRWSAGNGGGVGCGASGDEWCIELGYGGGGYLQLQQSYGYL
jgi:hypothetical protein